MDDKEEGRENRRKLKALMDAASYVGHRFGESGYEIAFSSKYRDWDMRANLYSGWLNLSIYVLELPDPGPKRSRLLERTAEMNDRMSLAKFATYGKVLTLQLQYREEHLDATIFGNLVSLLVDFAETHYPEIFGIVSVKDTLESLEAAFQRLSVPENSN